MQPPAPACVAPGPRGGGHGVVRLAGPPTSRGVSSVVLVPSLAGAWPRSCHSKGSEETLLDFARFKPFHRRFWIPKAYIIRSSKRSLGSRSDCVATVASTDAAFSAHRCRVDMRVACDDLGCAVASSLPFSDPIAARSNDAWAHIFSANPYHQPGPHDHQRVEIKPADLRRHLRPRWPGWHGILVKYAGSNVRFRNGR